MWDLPPALAWPLNKLLVMDLLAQGGQRHWEVSETQQPPPTVPCPRGGGSGMPLRMPGSLYQLGADSADSSNSALSVCGQVWRVGCLPKSQSKPGLCSMVEHGCRNIGSGVRGVMFGFLLVENASYSGLGCLICSQTCFFIRLQRGL